MKKAKDLEDMLLDALIEDLSDPQKRTPGLYQVVRGVVNDHRDEIGTIPKDVLNALEQKISDAVPFKFGG